MMSFIKYVRSKHRLIVVFFLINGFALFVNVFNIEWSFSGKCTDSFKVFTSQSDEKEKHFWPIVEFTRSEEVMAGYHVRSTGEEVMMTCNYFYGIFTDYDYSEFLGYTVILVAFLYFRWVVKAKREKEKF
jgi:hypothetical protein